MTEPAFDVFLCHRSGDKPAVEEIGRALRDRGLRPWLDVWELRPGVPWQPALEEQIRTIRAAAVFVGAGGRGLIVPGAGELLVAGVRIFGVEVPCATGSDRRSCRCASRPLSGEEYSLLPGRRSGTRQCQRGEMPSIAL